MKTLDLSLVLKDFEGGPIKANNKEMTLRDALLLYCSQAGSMDISTTDQAEIYAVGCRIGVTKGAIELEQDEYDSLKKIVDNGMVRDGQQKTPLFGLIVSQQVRKLVNEAENVKSEDDLDKDSK